MTGYLNPFEKPLPGLQIKDWVWHHSHNSTEFTKLAKRMNFCFNLKDETIYETALIDNVPVVKEKESKNETFGNN